MAREMEITKGRVKDKGKTWFPQLVDKLKDVRITKFTFYVYLH